MTMTCLWLQKLSEATEIFIYGDIEKTRIRQMLGLWCGLDGGLDQDASSWTLSEEGGKTVGSSESFLCGDLRRGGSACGRRNTGCFEKRQIKEWETADGTVVTITDGKT